MPNNSNPDPSMLQALGVVPEDERAELLERNPRMHYHVATVGPDGLGWVIRWRGDMFVDEGFPQMTRLLVRPGQRLIVALQDEGRLVAVIDRGGGTYMLPLREINLNELPRQDFEAVPVHASGPCSMGAHPCCGRVCGHPCDCSCHVPNASKGDTK